MGLALSLMTVVGLSVAQAGLLEIPFHAGSQVRFAAPEEATGLLAAADPWVQALSPFDRSARTGQTDDPGQEAFLEFAAAQAKAWSAAEMEIVRAVVESAGERIEGLGLQLSLPPIVLMVRTTGAEEGGKPYTRQHAIILPDDVLAWEADQLERLFLHELFHIMSRHDPSIRDALYGIIGYRPCRDVPFPEELGARKMTNPDAFHLDWCIDVEVAGAARTVTPILYAKAVYGGGELFDSMVFHLMAVEESKGRWRPARDHGGLKLFEPGEISGFLEKIGRNTGYIIHPEETMADNFVFAVLQRDELPSPEIPARLLEALRPGTGVSSTRPATRPAPSPRSR